MITCPRSPGCTYCPACSNEALHVLRMTGATDSTDYLAWLTELDRKHRFRTAGTRGELRTTQHDCTPPDPYAAAIARLQQGDSLASAERSYQPPALRPTEIPADGTPPDPYAAALERMHKENR